VKGIEPAKKSLLIDPTSREHRDASLGERLAALAKAKNDAPTAKIEAIQDVNATLAATLAATVLVPNVRFAQ